MDLTGKTATCSSCHVAEGAGTPPAAYHRDTVVIHSPQDAGSLDCARCHETTNVRDLHVTNGCATCHATYNCSECHKMHNANPGTPLLSGLSCSKSCHKAQGTDYHKTFSADHTYSAMGAGCQGSNCHANTLVEAHESYVGEGNRYPDYEDTCALCHLNEDPERVPASATADCVSCHAAQHGDIATAHQSTGGADFVSIGVGYPDHDYGWGDGYGSSQSCSDCHITDLLALHVNNCDACHASSDTNVLGAISSGSTGCPTCHPSQHTGSVGAHEGEYGNSNSDCGSCHGSGCTGCHGPYTPNAIPTTTSDVQAAYSGDATIHLTASDGDSGTFGIKATYYTINGGAATKGTLISIPAPVSGTQSYTLQYWSTDWSGNVETAHTADFTVSKDTVAPATASDAQSSYVWRAVINLTATDTSQAGVKATHYTIDGGQSSTGTVITVNGPATGSAEHTVTFWSEDYSGNVEAVQTKTFSITADLVVPSTTTDIPAVTNRSAYTWRFYPNDAAPSSGIASVFVAVDGAPASAYRTVDGWAAYLWVSQGSHTITYYATDYAGNVEGVKTATMFVDSVQPTGSISINAGAANTTSTNVTLALSATDNATGISDMCISNTYGSPTNWEPYTTTKSWTLSTGLGTKYVYVWYRDGAGNIRYYSDTINLVAGTDTAPPTGTMSVNNGAAYTTATAATVNSAVTDNIAVTQMSIDPGSGTYGPWIAYAATSSITLPAGNGTKTVRVQYRDAAGNTLARSDTIVLDAAAPTGSVSINSGATSTNSTSVTLTLSATDTGGSTLSQMRFSNDNAVWSAWEGYATSKSWVLSAGDGDKTVYAQFRDGAGNTSTSYSDGITLSGTGGSGTATTSLINPDSYTFVDANEDASGAWATYSIYVNDTLVGTKQASPDPTWSCPPISMPSGGHVDIVVDCGFDYYDFLFGEGRPNTYTLTLPAGATGLEGAVWTGFPDKNVVTDYWEPYNDMCTWVDIGPFTISNIVYATSGPTDTVAPTGSISINGGAVYSGATAVTLGLSASDTGGSGLYQMRFSNDNAVWSAWETYASSKSWTLTPGTGAKTVYVQYKDNAGNMSSSYSDGITLDATAPTGTMSVNANAGYSNSTGVTVNSSVNDALSGGVQMSVDPGTGTYGSWMAYSANYAITLPAGDGTKTVRVQYRDAVGNLLARSDAIFLDATAPFTTVNITAGQTYTGDRTFTLTPTDAGSGIAGTWWQLDGTGGTWTNSTSVPVSAPSSGTQSRTLYWYSRDNAGNQELQKSVTFTLAASGSGTATLAFRWEGWGYADLHVEDSYGNTIASTNVEGAGSDLNWYVTVPAGAEYRMVADYWYDYDIDKEGSGEHWTGVVTAGQTVEWWY